MIKSQSQGRYNEYKHIMHLTRDKMHEAKIDKIEERNRQVKDNSWWSNRNSHSFLVGMQNGIVTLEDSLAVSYKTKHNFLPYNLVIAFLNIGPENWKSMYCSLTYT